MKKSVPGGGSIHFAVTKMVKVRTSRKSDGVVVEADKIVFNEHLTLCTLPTQPFPTPLFHQSSVYDQELLCQILEPILSVNRAWLMEPECACQSPMREVARL